MALLCKNSVKWQVLKLTLFSVIIVIIRCWGSIPILKVRLLMAICKDLEQLLSWLFLLQKLTFSTNFLGYFWFSVLKGIYFFTNWAIFRYFYLLRKENEHFLSIFSNKPTLKPVKIHYSLIRNNVMQLKRQLFIWNGLLSVLID